MRKYTLISSIVVALNFISCQTTRNTGKMSIVSKIGDTNIDSDNLEIISYNLNGNFLEMKLSYMGGCQNHQFEFIGSENISKSLPPIRNVKLVHNSNGDTCKVKQIMNLKIDLRSLSYKQNESSEIFLVSDQWKERILFKNFK